MNGARTPRRSSAHAWQLVLAIALALGAVGVRAEEPIADTQAGIATLMRMLEERDAVIDGLRRRLDALERTVIGTTQTQETPPAPATSGSAAHSTAAQPNDTTAPAPRAEAARGGAGSFDVDVDAAERALERTLVVTGALLLPAGQIDITTGLSYTRSEQSAPILYTEQGVQYLATRRVRRDLFGADLSVRIGLPFESQLEIGIPYRHARQQAVTQVGFSPLSEASTRASGSGDPHLGLAKGLLHERNWWPDLIARVDWDTAFGQDEANGISLGGGFNELQASLTMTKRQDPLVFTGSAAYETTLKKGDVKPGDRIGVSVGALLAASPETSLRVALNQSYIRAMQIGSHRVAGTDRLSAMLSLGASSIVGHGKFIDVSAGVGLTSDAPDFSLGLSFSYRLDR